jgi:hyaluronate lyase
VLNSPVVPAEPIGHRHYPESDYTIHRKADYFISVRNQSRRTQGSEDLQGFHRADGYTYISLTGNEYWGDNVQPAMNWYYASGTTVEFQTPPLKSDHRGGTYKTFPTLFGKPGFVGGAHTESEGASAADFAPNYSCLTGKKSWFFFDEEMVALGSDLTCDSDNPVRTTITQWPLSSLSAPLVVNNIDQPLDLDWSQALGRIHWIHLENIGYFFPTPQFIYGVRRNQSGNWGDLAVGLDPTPRTHPFVTLWFEHGTNISDATYQYAVVPNIAKDQMLAYASANPLRVLANDSAIHAVKKPKINAVGAVFWQPGAIDKVTVNRPCIVYYKQSGNVVEIAVAKPTHNAATLKLTYNERLYPLAIPSEVSVTSGATTMLTVNVSQGKNYLSTFSTTPP